MRGVHGARDECAGTGERTMATGRGRGLEACQMFFSRSTGDYVHDAVKGNDGEHYEDGVIASRSSRNRIRPGHWTSPLRARRADLVPAGRRALRRTRAATAVPDRGRTIN